MFQLHSTPRQVGQPWDKVDRMDFLITSFPPFETHSRLFEHAQWMLSRSA